MLRATHSDEVKLGGWVVPCYVLEDERRVLAGKGIFATFDIRGHGTTIAHRIAKLLQAHIANQAFYKDILSRIEAPIEFRDLSNRKVIGYEGEVLIELCQVFLKARRYRSINTVVGQRYAAASEVLVAATANLGIIGLIDEATGFEKVRRKRSLEELLDKFLRKELAKWAKTFPDEFYLEMFRLKGWKIEHALTKRPGVVGHLTNDLVYARLAPGIIRELRKLNPKLPSGERANRHHQWLTEEIGHPALRQLLSNEIFMMRGAATWDSFYRHLERSAPKYGETLPLLLTDSEGEPA